MRHFRRQFSLRAQLSLQLGQLVLQLQLLTQLFYKGDVFDGRDHDGGGGDNVQLVQLDGSDPCIVLLGWLLQFP